MGPTDEKELSEAEIQAGLHWDYVEKTLQIHCIDQSELDLCATTTKQLSSTVGSTGRRI